MEERRKRALVGRANCDRLRRVLLTSEEPGPDSPEVGLIPLIRYLRFVVRTLVRCCHAHWRANYEPASARRKHEARHGHAMPPGRVYNGG